MYVLDSNFLFYIHNIFRKYFGQGKADIRLRNISIICPYKTLQECTLYLHLLQDLFGESTLVSPAYVILHILLP